jgi:uncharacterized protein YegL
MEDKKLYLVRKEDLIENPTPRLPVCLVLDTSGSMQGAPINELNEGVRIFYKAILEDDIARLSAEIAIVTFGNGGVQILNDFASIERQNVPRLVADGLTPMGQAINTALDLLENRKNEYKAAGVDYYQPWMVVMTDGFPTDDVTNAIQRTRQLVENRKLVVFPLAIGDGADKSVLEALSGKKALKLKGLNFKDFFVWLSKSVSKVSQSTPGEKVKLDTKAIEEWAEVF